jgi:hypothetical protein
MEKPAISPMKTERANGSALGAEAAARIQMKHTSNTAKFSFNMLAKISRKYLRQLLALP